MRKYIFLLPFILIGQTMTVYRDNVALIKEPMHWSVKSGVNEISYNQLPEGLISESLFLNLQGATVSYQRLNKDIFNSDRYFRDKIGDYVYVKIRNGKIHDGTLIEMNNKNISLQSRKEVTTIVHNTIDYIYAHDTELNPLFHPELVWTIQSAMTGTISGDLVYLSEGFKWDATYRLLLNGSKGELITEAIVTNNSNMDYSNVNLQLVEGNLQHQGSRPQPTYRTGMHMEAMTAAPPEMKADVLGDYHIYSLSERIDVKKHQSITVRLYEPRVVNYKKTYVFENTGRGKKEEPLRIEIKFANTEANGLNIPLPQGKISLYLRSASGALEYGGVDRLQQVPKGETAVLSAGRAFDVIGKRTVLHYDRQRKSEEAAIEITVKNKKDETVNIRLEEKISGDWVIKDASDNYIKKDASTIYFPLTLAAGDSKTVTYTYRKEWK